MTETDFKPIVYLKQNCPFCPKVRLFALEAGLQDRANASSCNVERPPRIILST